LNERLSDYRTTRGGCELRANLLQPFQRPVFVAIEALKEQPVRQAGGGRPLGVGDRVLARWRGRAREFPGVIVRVHPGGTYGIAYDDGDRGDVRREHVCRVRTRKTTYYAQVMLCFSAKYLGASLPLCYVRWLHTARAVAQASGRAVLPAETRGPFESYRWAIGPGGQPWYGVVHASKIMHCVHMVHSMDDSELFRLNTDVWHEYL
jgi:hypothetical protein